MATLELYINAEAGGFHTFLRRDGSRLTEPESNFTSQSVDEMLAKAVELLEGDSSYSPSLRIYDHGHKMFKRDVSSFQTLKQLRVWTMSRPAGALPEPCVNEEILGRKMA
jgi:hypothetical protein